ncbi:MAG TPA: thiopeptide-type bacteriocin biosynthesis protein [Actinocrinis sp.]|uniref:thiopeptide-type bacteriocin biosynthesis protein n=1 Tax=Actinocrinis sp. TaxID=1920516 RepID=UPI002DDD632C|nr:thiopeptide-type bacteriocin biosynthesis protein [Actinocrinis sp.]HEV3171677.1 thiopeptide-type bacteriocin biosynthesis protein [Actinocrinis sp.]
MAEGWTSLHCMLHCAPETVDEFLLGDVAPLLDQHGVDQHRADWFFIRYGEGGPHLRIRVRGDAVCLAEPLGELAAKLPTVAGPWPSTHAAVHLVPYVPETRRYGGAAALPIAEDVFVRSTQTALRAISEAPHRTARLTAATDLAIATGLGLGMDRLGVARWLRRHARAWQHADEVELLPAPVVHAKVNSVYAVQRDSLVRRVEALTGPGTTAERLPGVLGDWHRVVQDADACLRAETGFDGSPDDGEEYRAPWPWVWASQLHMLLNRLGIVPDEERALCHLVARALLDDDEPTDFFPQDRRAPDIRYLERSKFHVGRREDSASREVALPAPATVGGTPLPGRPLPDVTLNEALTRRVCTRGALTGPLTATDLGTLLWNSYAETHHTGQQPHRPYPSAGALYTARLRVFALAVDGLAPGCYEADPVQRVLRRIGALPPVHELKALSPYFSRALEDAFAIGLDEAPVLLGLYVDLGLLRQRYGLRALRLGLLEAGHLAQTLLLVAAALGLGCTPVNGVNDDLAHDLFSLDDLDQPLQYLLPIGRSDAVGG